MSYWQDRMAKAQDELSRKSAKDIEKQLKKYYGSAMKNAISSFEAVYDKILKTQEAGSTITPADLYKLDKYWEAQSQLQRELDKLGDKEIAKMSDEFEANFMDVYRSISLKDRGFNTIDASVVSQLVNSIWLADGKSWSERIWDNLDHLRETLNEELVNCVVNGRGISDLKHKLTERFNVSFSQANMLVETEIAHIQKQAASRRYKDAGIEQEQVWASEDERRCDVCGKLHEKLFPVGEAPIPAHPRCRCTVLPVINEDEFIMEEENMKKYELHEQEKEQLERVKQEFPDRFIENEEYYNRLKNRAETFLKDIKSVLSGEMNGQYFFTKNGLNGTQKGQQFHNNYVDRLGRVTKDYTEFFLKLKEEYEKDLERAQWKDVFLLYDFVFCVDCGKPILKEGKKNNAQKRCPECQLIHRRLQKAEAERVRRKRKKAK